MKLNKKIKKCSIILACSLTFGAFNINIMPIINSNNEIVVEATNTDKKGYYYKTTFKEVSVGSGKYTYVRSSGSALKNNILGKLKHGEVVEVTRETTNWYWIKKGNLAGWVNKKDMKNTTKQANVNYWYYKSDETDITINKKRAYDSDIYVAKIKINNAIQFKHVYANSSINSLNTVKNLSSKYNAILAINASGFNKNNAPTGTVGSTGKIDRFIPGKTSLILGYDGKLNLRNAKTTSDLTSFKPFWVTSFGPTLVNNYKNVQINSTNNDRHPRMAIAQGKSANEFIIIAVDGRSNTSKGVTLKQLATLFEKENVRVAYNLDGGGSATMVFDGYVINKPCDSTGPRKVLDTIFIRDIGK